MFVRAHFIVHVMIESVYLRLCFIKTWGHLLNRNCTGLRNSGEVHTTLNKEFVNTYFFNYYGNS